jgi:hypothetical protein
MDALCHRTGAVLVALIGIALSLVAVPAVAQAATVSVRVEAAGGPLVPKTDVSLPSGPVAPAGAAADQTCPGDSVIGAIHAATGGDWTGQWTSADGWSIERVGNVNIPAGSTRRWAAYVNDTYSAAAPCSRVLKEGDRLLVYPVCTTAQAQCFTGHMEIEAPATGSPGVRLGLRVWEIDTTFDGSGNGTSSRVPSVNAAVYGPDDSTTTDIFFGYATLTLTQRGPNTVSAGKGPRLADRTTVCITDGADGYCGTSPPAAVPFDPLQNCQTTGSDGLCQTIDKQPPNGHISAPVQAKKYLSKSRPRVLRGTVDSDPSEVNEVRLRLVRQSRIPGTKVVKRKVTVKRRIGGKLVRKRVVKTQRVRVRRTTCFVWNAPKSAWRRLRSCKTIPSEWFAAEGTDAWSYEFLDPLPGGRYTLDAQAVDGAGNVDGAAEVGRNRVTFTAA